VSDEGIGISPRFNSIFEPFYTKKEMGRSGTGLGLSVVWGAVKDHKGYIDVQSEEKKEPGLIFTSRNPGGGNDKKSSVPSRNFRGRRRSWWSDDIKEQREIASMMLAKLGYHVSTPAAGRSGEYLEKNTADLVILDMIMDSGWMDWKPTKRSRIESVQKAILVSGYSEPIG